MASVYMSWNADALTIRLCLSLSRARIRKWEKMQTEWRNLGVQQSRGWEHYAIHRPEPHIMLFRYDSMSSEVYEYISCS